MPQYRVIEMSKNIFLSFLFFCLPVVAAAESIGSICSSGVEAAIPATTPTNQFTFDFEDGEVVTDNKTGLMWSRCPLGYQWEDNTCNYTSDKSMSWMEALDFVAQNKTAETPHLTYSDWRLPNIKELASIIERRCSEPSVNQYLFGYTAFSSLSYWSNTHYISSTDVRVVNYYFGSLHSSSATNELLVRLVRDVP